MVNTFPAVIPESVDMDQETGSFRFRTQARLYDMANALALRFDGADKKSPAGHTLITHYIYCPGAVVITRSRL